MRWLLLASALVGCYSPDLRDCTVTCTKSTDCADGQSCSTDHKCVADGVRSCGSMEQPDAAQPTTVPLHVTITGKGVVVVDGNPQMMCGAGNGGGGDCTYTVTLAATHHLVAGGMGSKMFQMWSGDCSGTAAICTLTPTGAASVGAAFGN